MSIDPDTFRQVAEATAVVRAPKQALATFGVTTIPYYLVTEPVYSELVGESKETVVRHGRVTAERPQIVTPYYLLSLFSGFEHGKEYAQYLAEHYGRNSPGLMYSYKNELQETTIVSDPPPTVAQRLVDDLEKQGERKSAVIQGVDFLWDVSLMKFIFELTVSSLGSNVAELAHRGMLGMEDGLPRAVRVRLDAMFSAVKRGELNPSDLKAELDRWGVFREYEDRFLDLFRRRR
ncbi:MAG: hypothetical protein ACOX87_00110 [Chloroflexota bacterium]|jgi:hypothetical protein